MSDGWVDVGPAKGPQPKSTVTFYGNANQVRVPQHPEAEPTRADWQTHPDRPNLVRLRFHDEGVLGVVVKSQGRAWIVPKRGLERAINRTLVGEYPCTIEPDAFVIDLSEVHE